MSILFMLLGALVAGAIFVVGVYFTVGYVLKGKNK
jgi:hypothetical protein